MRRRSEIRLGWLIPTSRQEGRLVDEPSHHPYLLSRFISRLRWRYRICDEYRRHGDECIIIEYSSGGKCEDLLHTYRDNLEILDSLAVIVVSKAYKMSDASFIPFVHYKAIGIQTIKRKLILCTLSMNEGKQFVLQEKRSATIRSISKEVIIGCKLLKLLLVCS